MVEPRNGDSSSVSSTPRRASARDTAEIIGTALLPTLAMGMIKRRPNMMRAAQRLGWDRAAIGLLRELRRRSGGAPVLLSTPGRAVVVVLSACDVAKLLDQTPHSFTAATMEKRAALGHFQPHGVLISTEPERAMRREFTEAVLQPDRDMHQLGERIMAVARHEASQLLALTGDRLDWEKFNRAWWRMTRRLVLGDHARDDSAITDLLDRLRSDANWAFPRRCRRPLRRRLHTALDAYLERAAPGSLVHLVAEATGNRARAEAVAPTSQLAHWLFALDAAGMVTLRALALLASHPAHRERVRAEITAPGQLPGPYLRGCLLDTVRLWPTTPIVLRQSAADTSWGRALLPAGTHFVIYAPFFHRDPDALAQAADRFTPELWLNGTGKPGLLPFSYGPAACPGRGLVLQLSGAMLTALLHSRDYRLHRPSALDQLGPSRDLPATLNHFDLSFTVTAGAA